MKLLDLTLPSPAENLACDEVLLDLCENERVETLRFWESREHFVVVGYGNQVALEVNVEECRRLAIPILRRCSGGGTVVQGPGCLNYSVTLRIPEAGPLISVAGTNELVMERNRAALEALLGASISVQGHTDLAFAPHGIRNPNPNRNPSSEPEITIASRMTIANQAQDSPWLKFSGNAQRRRRHALVFHGTILYDFDLVLIDRLLRLPSIQPEYRADRAHDAFVRNISAGAGEIRSALRQAWNAREVAGPLPMDAVQALVRAQYGNERWNFRR